MHGDHRVAVETGELRLIDAVLAEVDRRQVYMLRSGVLRHSSAIRRCLNPSTMWLNPTRAGAAFPIDGGELALTALATPSSDYFGGSVRA
jgi:hypothetical protein